jgi:unsaturated pyranuronate lyase
VLWRTGSSRHSGLILFSFSEDAVSRFFPSPEECARHTIFPGVTIRTCKTDRLMVSVVDLEPRSVVEEHCHPHDQVGMLLEGKATFIIGGEEKTLQAGDVYCIPGGVLHKVITLDQPARALDIFTPIREEYL